MKKALLLFGCLLMAQLGMADPVTQDEAKAKATQFLNQRHKGHKVPGMRLASKGRNLSSATTTASYYVFNVGEEEGFVVVSGDDRTPAILGYGTKGSFDANQLPDNMRAWLQGYSDQLDYLNKHADARLASATLDEHPAVAPLLTSRWGQDTPYNDLCPTYRMERTVTGCVATAMAQMMYYHKYPERTKATIPGYRTSSRNIQVDAISKFNIDWDNMLDRYDNSATATQTNAVARLMLACGAAVEMDYGLAVNGGSSASTSQLDQAICTYFDYDPKAFVADRGNYRANAWNNLIYNEVANHRPVVYGGQSTGGGHAFVIDGYDREGLFHVNWGWNGTSDNYFLLSILDSDNNSGIGASSSSDGYSLDQDALIGAQPRTGSSTEKAVCMTTHSINATSGTIAKNYKGVYPVYFTVEMYNLTGAASTFDYGAAVIDDNGKQKAVKLIGSQSFENQHGLGRCSMSIEVPDLSDGNYQIVPVSKKSGTTEWLPNIGSGTYYLEATISNNTLKLQAPVIDLTGTITFSGKKEVGSPVMVKAEIKNNGTFFNGQLAMTVDGYAQGGKYFEVEAGATATFEMSFIPDEAGNRTIKIYRYNNQTYYNPVIAQGTVNIAAAKAYDLRFSNGVVLNAQDNIISNSTAKLQVDIENRSQYDYDDYIKTWVMTPGEDNYWNTNTSVDTPVTIGAGSKETVTIDVPNLANGDYWFILCYKTNGQFISIGDSRSYTDFYDYAVSYSVDLTHLGDQLNELRQQAQQLLDENTDMTQAAYLLSNALEETTDVEWSEEALNDAIDLLSDAIDQASIIIKAEKTLPQMLALTESTNVYTDEALENYYTQWQTKYEAGTMTKEEAEALTNPFLLTAEGATGATSDFLLSAWDGNGYYVNTWSNEEFGTPFIEYVTETGAANLKAKIMTATLTDLPIGYYDVESSMLLESSGDTPEGVFMQVGKGKAVALTTGTVEASGSTTKDGTLTIKLQVNGVNNVSRLAFKNMRYTFNEETTGITEATQEAKAASHQVYDLQGRQLNGMPMRKGLYIVNHKIMMK